MAKYVLKYKDKLWANAELYTECLVKGDRTLIRMLGTGEVKGTRILDEVVYSLTTENEMKAFNECDVNQNIDAALRCIERASDRHEHTIKIPGKLDTYKDAVHGVTYIKVRSFPWQSKYRLLSRLPVVTICGTKYVALNAYDTLCDDPIVVTVCGK